MKTKKTLWLASFLLASFCLSAPNASAEVIIRGKKEAPEAAPPLIPNLSVTFNLNSALDEQDTAYYSAIVEELLKNLPRRVELYGENRELLSPSKNLDHMKVVAYLPTSKEDGLSGEKELRYFDVEFFAPEKKVKVNEVDGFSKEDMNKAIVVRKERYDDFLKKVSSMKDSEAKPVMNVADAFNKMESNPKLGDSVSAEALMPVRDPAVQMAEMKDKPAAQSTKEPARKKSASTASSGLKKTGQVELAYFGDEVNLEEGDKQKLLKFLKKRDKSAVKKIRIISQSLSSSPSEAAKLGEKRADMLKGLLKSQGFDLSSAQVSEIVVQAAFFQSLSVEIVY